MLVKMFMDGLSYNLARFRKEEDGIALTEYLILLGLLTLAVIAAVLVFGTNLAGAWNAWASWIGSNVTGPKS